MFLRTVKATSGGEVREYLRLVETYREGGKIKQRVIQTLGRKDQLIPHLDTLIKLLAPERSHERQAMGELTARNALTWGPVVVARHLWDRLELDDIVRRCCRSRNGRELADRVFVLTASRFCSPSSEHGLAWWLEESYVTDRLGRRYMPAWKRSGRVQVDSRQLARWYRTLDALITGKDQIERQVYLRLRDLFSLKVDLVFYDLTSTYFEGHGPEPLACHGYSRDQRPRDRQVQVGVVMAGGWPIAHHVFDGRIKEHRTVAQVVKDLRDRFDIGRIVFVGDRGMVSRETIDWLKKEGVPYIVGLRRRRNRPVDEYLKAAKSMRPICAGDLEVYELDGEDGERVVIVRSSERLDYERGMRRKVMKRVWPKLKGLEERVRTGRLRDSGKIGAAAQRIVSESHGYRYFRWSVGGEGQLSVRVDREKLRREMRLEGTYVIATDQELLSPLEIVQAYKELAGVERAFRESKDFLQLRPIYHRNESRVRAHIFVVALSFLLYRALERALTKAGVGLSVRQALRALESVRLVELESGGESRWLVTRPNHQARAVLKAFGLGTLQPPTTVEKRAT
jgi:transposase